MRPEVGIGKDDYMPIGEFVDYPSIVSLNYNPFFMNRSVQVYAVLFFYSSASAEDVRDANTNTPANFVSIASAVLPNLYKFISGYPGGRHYW